MTPLDAFHWLGYLFLALWLVPAAFVCLCGARMFLDTLAGKVRMPIMWAVAVFLVGLIPGVNLWALNSLVNSE